MTFPQFRWVRLLALTALVGVTTGIAASPVQDRLLPFVAKSVGLHSRVRVGPAPAAALAPLTVVTRDDGARAFVRREKSRISEPARLMARPWSDRDSGGGEADAHKSEDNGESTGRQQSDVVSRRSGRGLGHTFAFGGGALGGATGALNHGRAVSALAATGGDNNNNDNSGGGSNANGGGSNGNGGGLQPPLFDGLFDEHTAGLTDLVGDTPKDGATGSLISGGGGNNLASLNVGTVAANPEPSTFLLLGTGLAAAAGALRRRLSTR